MRRMGVTVYQGPLKYFETMVLEWLLFIYLFISLLLVEPMFVMGSTVIGRLKLLCRQFSAELISSLEGFKII